MTKEELSHQSHTISLNVFYQEGRGAFWCGNDISHRLPTMSDASSIYFIAGYLDAMKEKERLMHDR